MQVGDDLIFYATSAEAYSMGAAAFPDIFIEDGSFICKRGFVYLRYIDETP